MPLDPNIILAAGRGVTPVDTPLQMEVKRSALAEIRQRAEDAQQARQAAQDFQFDLQATGGDYEGAFALGEQRGHNMLPYREQLQKQRNAVLDSMTKQLDMEKKKSDALGQIMPGIQSQDDWNFWAPVAARIDPEFVQHVGPQYDKQRFDSFGHIGVDAGKIFDAAQKANEAARKGEFDSWAANYLRSTRDDSDLDAFEQIGQQIGAPPAILRKYVRPGEHWSPELVDRANTLALGAQKAAGEDKLQSPEVEAIKAWSREHGGAQPTQKDLEQIHRGFKEAGTIVRVTGGTGGGSASDMNDQADMIAHGLMLPSMMSKRAGSYNTILAKANAISKKETGKPLNFLKMEADYKAAQRWAASMNGNQMVRFKGLANSVVNTIDEVKRLGDQLQQGGVQKWNAAKRSTIQQLWGNSPQSETAAQYVAAVNTLKEEFANLATGGFAPTDAAWSLANGQINGDYGVKDLNASLGEVQRLINYRIGGFDQIPVVSPYGGDATPGPQQPAAPPPQSQTAPPTGGMVWMRAPKTGQMKQVPASDVDRYRAAGAVVVKQ